MSAARPATDPVLTREEYRRWRAAQPRGRFERIDGRVIRMAAERVSHVRTKVRVLWELRRAVTQAGLRCEALGDGITVETGDSDYEPDALVNCGPPLGDDDVAATSPVVIVEVMSPGTQSVDTGEKLIGYFALPTVSHYLIVHPTRHGVIHHRRTGEGIATSILAGGTAMLDPPGITVLIDNFYTDEPTAP